MTEIPVRAEEQRGVELTPMGLLRVIYRWRGLVLALAIGLPLVTAVVMLLTPNRYTASGTILLEAGEAPQGMEMLGQLGALAGLPTSAPTAESYLTVLRSRRVREAVAESLSLGDHYGIEAANDAHRMEKTLAALDHAYETEAQGGTAIRVKATDEDPQVAADIVNAFLDQLILANQTLSLTRARRTRQLVEEALVDTESELQSARERMSEFQRRYGVFALDEQTSATVELITELQQQLIEAQTRRDALGATLQQSSSNYRQLNYVIDALQERISSLVGRLGAQADSGAVVVQWPAETEGEGFILPLSKVPELSGEYAHVLMDLKVLETKYRVLATKLEQTKIEESQSMPSFEILDRAARPYRKSGPNRTFFTLSAFLGGLLAGILLAVLLEDLQRHLSPGVRAELISMLPAPVRTRFFSPR